MDDTLGDKLVHLSLEIDDKKKTIDLLHNLIDDQRDRHKTEAETFVKERENALQQLLEDNDEALRDLFKANDSLAIEKTDIETRVDALLAEKQAGTMPMAMAMPRN